MACLHGDKTQMKPLPRIALSLALLFLKRGATGAKPLKSHILLWSFGGLSFLFLSVSLIITLSTRLSPELACFIIGGLLALAFIAASASHKHHLNKRKTSLGQIEFNDAALSGHIPKEIKDHEAFKSLMTSIETRPHSAILLSLFLGLIIGQHIQDNN